MLSYDDLLAILKISWQELDNMDFPELPKDERAMQEELSHNIIGATIGDILTARGILLKTTQAK